MVLATQVHDVPVVWAPQEGSQKLFLQCPIFEVLYHGTRGPGKTDALLMDFAQFVGRGFGAEWRGILFRKTYKQLDDVVAKSHKWFRRIFPKAKFNKSDYVWEWPTGEALLLRYMNEANDYWNYHGHAFPFIAFEEATNWADSECYMSMFACCRSTHPGLPRRYRATCNPYGVGHNWVKARFIDVAPPGVPYTDPVSGKQRVHLFGSIYENKILMQADPEYVKNIEAIDDPNKRRAWLYGDWDIVAGAMFGDEWDKATHVLQPFTIPRTWRVDRSFDWGSSRPFSVGWWAESDGSEVEVAPGVRRTFPRGSLFRVSEYYGWSGKPNEGCRLLAAEVARRIKEIEAGFEFQVYPGPADTSIFDVMNGQSIADDMQRMGVRWERADKSPGSRKQGWERMRRMFKAAQENRPDEPHLYVFDTCRHFIRTVPSLPMDEKHIDDIDTDAEDHVADEARYRVLAAKRENKPFNPYG